MLEQTLEQQQRQSLTTRQIQQIKLLELPVYELEERIRTEIENNPALEEGEEPNDQEADEVLEPSDDAYDEPSGDNDNTLDDYSSEDDIPDYKLKEISRAEKQREEIPFANTTATLSEHLLNQLRLRTLTEQQMLIGDYVIGSLREDGYLDRSALSIANDILFKESLDIPTDQVQQMIDLIKTLDPVGVASATLQECLLTQLYALDRQDQAVATAIRILEKKFDDFANRRFNKILSSQIDPEALKAATAVITHLNPKPGNGFGESIHTNLTRINPDFVVSEIDGQLELQLTDEREIPSLRVTPAYKEMQRLYRDQGRKKRSDHDKEANKFVRQKIDQANWFISALAQRYETLRNTMSAIMVLQDAFFRSGAMSDLKPMILKDISDMTGYDVSTVSRVTNSKYVQCDYGIYLLKNLFSESATTDDGEEISTKEIKETIEQLIADEDKSKPLTDEKLCALLNDQGYQIARRTVAKYREMLDIPTSRLRRGLK